MERTPTQEAELERIGLAESEKTEDDHVREWRFLRMGKLTDNDEFAAEVAGSDVDVHDLERLLSAGCAIELAWDILR
jgi:hypothetical protein